MAIISDYITSDLIVDIVADTSVDVIDALVGALDTAGKLRDRDLFFDAILEREDAVTTAIGSGIAIPHAKLSEYDDFFIVIGIIRDGVEWNALDGKPVTIAFMVGGPDDKQARYLQMLSEITMLAKDETRREKMLTLSPEEIAALITEQGA